MKRIIDFDKWLFIKINRDGSTPFLDKLMPVLREPTNWIPLYFFLFLFVVISFGKKGWWFVLYGITTVAITDSVSSRIFKPLIGRVRPCCDPDFSSNVRLLVGCGGNGSFTSSHAANHFGLAMFLFLTFRSFMGNWAYVFFIWAAAISYAQIYVGVHYPFDVLGGTILGCLVGWASATIFHQKNGLLTRRVQHFSYA
ncbi:MAG TPA: phosphatase PAP2 family protein [Ferruginibacter sp.]|jgi:membrane-associated phospholipid phosphatase|nr:phosphatase PAP2 family protein [Ferruginibacter sp.]